MPRSNDDSTRLGSLLLDLIDLSYRLDITEVSGDPAGVFVHLVERKAVFGICCSADGSLAGALACHGLVMGGVEDLRIEDSGATWKPICILVSSGASCMRLARCP